MIDILDPTQVSATDLDAALTNQGFTPNVDVSGAKISTTCNLALDQQQTLETMVGKSSLGRLSTLVAGEFNPRPMAYTIKYQRGRKQVCVILQSDPSITTLENNAVIAITGALLIQFDSGDILIQ
jgi:hypothetical protein